MEAEQLLKNIVDRWSEDENAWLLLIKLYAVTSRYGEVSKVIQKIDEKDIYLSPGGKETVKFWAVN